jgi:replication factor A1
MKPQRMALDEIVGRIVEEKGLSRKQVFDLIEKKKSLLSHMISDEGAADIVAKELGVRASPESEDEELTLTVADLVAGMSNVTISGRITKIGPVREFTDTSGNKSTVCNVVIIDRSGDLRVVLWGAMTNAVHENTIKVGAVVRINGGYVREDLAGRVELHVGKKGRIEIEPKDLDQSIFPELPSIHKRITELRPDMVETDFAGVIKDISPRRLAKTSDGREVTVSSLVVEDSSKATIRIVFWDSMVPSMENMRKGDQIEITSGRIRFNKAGEMEIHVSLGSAAKVISSERGIVRSEVRQTSKINELKPGVQNFSIEGVVAGDPAFKQFTRKDGTNGKLLSFTLADGSSKIRAVAWGESAEKLRALKDGDGIRIKELTVKTGIRDEPEIHIKGFEILGPPEKNNNEDLILAQSENQPGHAKINKSLRRDISQLTNDETAEIRGMITGVQTKSPIYRACPKCLRKVEEIEEKWICPKDGAVANPKIRVLYSLTLDDGTGTITCVLSGSSGEELLGIKCDDLKLGANGRLDDSSAILPTLLGLEMIFVGKCVFNSRQGRKELRITRVVKPDPRAEARILLEHIRNDLVA